MCMTPSDAARDVEADYYSRLCDKCRKKVDEKSDPNGDLFTCKLSEYNFCGNCKENIKKFEWQSEVYAGIKIRLSEKLSEAFRSMWSSVFDRKTSIREQDFHIPPKVRKAIEDEVSAMLPWLI